ncbi:hypothetical protein SUGI_0146610 [Cryptomeria japonica]|nr:hypothetical protein SUGI_0146610 [Cryptomeria japonica]
MMPSLASSQGNNQKRRKEKAKRGTYKRLRKRGNGNKREVLLREMKDYVITVVKESFRNVLNKYEKGIMDIMNAMKREVEAEYMKMLGYAEMGSIEQVGKRD